MAGGATVEGHDTPCVQCGYDLCTLPVDGTCPECGHSIRHSMAPQPLRNWSGDKTHRALYHIAWRPGTAGLWTILLILLALPIAAPIRTSPPTPYPIVPLWVLIFLLSAGHRFIIGSVSHAAGLCRALRAVRKRGGLPNALRIAFVLNAGAMLAYFALGAAVTMAWLDNPFTVHQSVYLDPFLPLLFLASWLIIVLSHQLVVHGVRSELKALAAAVGRGRPTSFRYCGWMLCIATLTASVLAILSPFVALAFPQSSRYVGEMFLILAFIAVTLFYYSLCVSEAALQMRFGLRRSAG